LPNQSRNVSFRLGLVGLSPTGFNFLRYPTWGTFLLCLDNSRWPLTLDAYNYLMWAEVNFLMKNFFSYFLLLTLLVAQTNTSAISGVVTDESGAAVPTATLTLTDVNTGAMRKATADSGGEYSFPQLAPGLYRLSVQASGFQGYVVEQVDLGIAQSRRADVKLRLGQMTETVTVASTSAPLLEPDTASIACWDTLARAFVDQP